MTRKIKSSVFLAVVFSAGLFVNASAGIEKVVEKSFDVKPGGTLIVDSDFGSIEVSGKTGNTVQIEVVMEADTRNQEKADDIFGQLMLDIDMDGNNVNVYGKYDREDEWSLFGHKNTNRLRVDFIITVPENFNVDLETGGGGIGVINLKGEIDCQTSGGGLYFESTDGSLRGRTSGGGVEMAQCKGRLDVETSGGGITISESEGEIYAHTSGGGIDIDEIKGMIEASTSGGGITAYISGQPTGDCSLTTSGGGIKVFVDEKVNLKVDARTSSGMVKSDFIKRSNDRRSASRERSSWRGEINAGGPELYLRTSAGNIYIDKI